MAFLDTLGFDLEEHVLDFFSHLQQHRRTSQLALLLVWGLLVWPAFSIADDEARTLISKREDLLRSQTNFGRYRMQLIRPTWERTIAFVSWDDVTGKRSFLRILAPSKDKDTTFLKVGSNLWAYLPKLEREIRLPPSMMLNAWMGSDFTNDDLVKAASIIDDYTHRTVERRGEGPEEVVTIESLPKPEAPVVWGKMIYRLTSEGIPLETGFYDEHGKLVRRLVYENVKEFKGHRLPTRWTMLPSAESGERTVLDIEYIEFDPDIPASVFERSHLSRRD